jgi:hypothetical protein
MKVVTIAQLEEDFDAIMDDVIENKQYYRIQAPDSAFMLVPYDEYEVLKEVYQDWVYEPTIDPDPLPVQYLGDAEPEDLTQNRDQEKR